MSTIVRVVYAGICEIWVETEGATITKILEVTASANLIGQKVNALPRSVYAEAKLLAEAPAPTSMVDTVGWTNEPVLLGTSLAKPEPIGWNPWWEQ